MLSFTKMRTFFKALFVGLFFLSPVIFVEQGQARFSALSAQQANSEVQDIQKIVESQENGSAATSFPQNDFSQNSSSNSSSVASAAQKNQQEKILRWKLAPGEILEIKKNADQYILLNGRKIQRQVNHRILLNVNSGSAAQGWQLAGSFLSSFRYYHLKTTAPYQEEDSFYSRFSLKPNGEMNVNDNFYMPNIRGLPTFPQEEDLALNNIPEGFTWKASGEEVLMAPNSNLIHIPLDVFYEYHGKTLLRDKDGHERTIHKIFMNYQIDYKNTQKEAGEIQSMYGFASVHMLWDESAGIPYKAGEVYDVMIRYGDGQFHEFRIKAQSDYKKIQAMSTAEKFALRNSLQDKISKFQKDDEPQGEVRLQKQGLSLQLPQILFDYDSDKLTEKSKRILREVISVLEKYPQRYFVIRGHTDNIGSNEYNQKLSAARAKAVTNFIMESSHIPADHLSYEGVGFREPVATNSNERGRAQNRRVEIFIPEK